METKAAQHEAGCRVSAASLVLHLWQRTENKRGTWWDWTAVTQAAGLPGSMDTAGVQQKAGRAVTKNKTRVLCTAAHLCAHGVLGRVQLVGLIYEQHASLLQLAHLGLDLTEALISLRP
jgi:hypothetical protein